MIGLLFAFYHADSSLYFGNHNETGDKYSGDSLQHLTGLNYFVQDEWRFPLLDVPDLAFAEGGGNIIYTDSLPLLALPAKLLYQIHPVLPDYFGFWLLVCFAMQPIAFCWVLRQRENLTARTALLGSIFALAIPAFLARYGHISLCSHFLILFAIGAYLAGRKDSRRGSVLLGLLALLGMLVTAYIFAMVFGFFAVHLARSWQSGQKSLRRAAAEGGILILAVVAVGWILGYWEFGRYNPPVSGYGILSMNLLSPFWPWNSGIFSALPPSPDATGGQYEGWNYLGLGILIGTILLVARRPKTVGAACGNHGWLLAYMVFLTVFAISHRVFVGSILLFEAPMPEPLYQFLSQFRSSGRMFWPVTYILALLIVIELSRWRGAWRYALPAVVLVQAVDAWPFVGAIAFRGDLSKEEQTRVAQWEELIAAHERVYLLPAYSLVSLDMRAKHRTMQHYASKLAVPVSTGYMSRRFSPVPPSETDRDVLDQLFDNEGLYIFLPPVMTASDAIGFFGRDAILREFDGVVIASARHEISGFLETLPIAQVPAILLGYSQRLEFGANGFRYLYGDMRAGPDFVWTHARKAGVVARVDEPGNADLIFRFTGVTDMPPWLSERTARFSVNGEQVAAFTIHSNQSDMRERSIRIPRHLIGEDGLIQIEWSFDADFLPEARERGEDPPLHGFGLSHFTIDSVGVGPRVVRTREVPFSAVSFPKFIDLTGGFSGAEEWGRWTDGHTAELEIRVSPAARGVVISFQCMGYLPDGDSRQRVTVFLNEREKAQWRFDPSKNEGLRRLEVASDEIPLTGVLKIRLQIETPRSPAAYGRSADDRQLGIGIRSVRVETIGPR